MTSTSTREDPNCFDALFGSPLSPASWWVRHQDGPRYPLPVGRWLGGEHADADDRAVDETLLGLCRGRTIDLACGPGRLVEELRRRGISAMGVDTSPAAVALGRERGAKTVLADIFDTVPHEGHWDTVLLVDGNIGIGGDPGRVIGRAHEIACESGSVLVEVDSPGTGSVTECLRIEGHGSVGPWYDWARIDAAALIPLATAAGLECSGSVSVSRRHFVRFVKPPHDAVGGTIA
ncbi:class I SAM-dependent methyltransferase [Rhodococcoides corynebacterioides]|uniref:methyltransferase domain-containing protein n=1 Tax=Rhodococcoides corynebacterioides TaxID=53972 RepID=UPI001C9A99C2|nr:class I SAM-dependent methyltransferase [Rhodococcus corynebacterioides]MBY6362503.1 class I SAM-dependent methyltransferase [Rhodococcus corynebacterioides]